MRELKIAFFLIGVSLVMSACSKEEETPDYIKSDQEFLTKATSINLFTIQAGLLAFEKARQHELVHFAEQLVNHHTNTQDKLDSLVKTYHFTGLMTMGEKYQNAYSELSRLHGAEFDQRYIAEMVNSHKEAVPVYEEAQQELENVELRELASGFLPIVKMHLDRAKQLQAVVTDQ